jgi:phosphohistidine phosphatase SixA
MRLYLVRHAEAAPGEPDELRPLTPAGRDDARALATRLREEGVRPDAVVTSPLLRARETGAAIARALDCAVEADERLAPGATADALLEAAAERGETLVAVGHQPDCGLIAAALTGEERRFPPAGMAVFDVPAP